MSVSANSAAPAEPGPALTREPDLVLDWVDAGLPEPLGLAAASGPGGTCVVAVTAEHVDPASSPAQSVAQTLAKHLGGEVRLITTAGPDRTRIVRDWLYQAADGSGRGVSVELAGEAGGRLTVLVSSIDSSAREVALRLDAVGGASAPEAVALARVLGHSSVIVRDAESSEPTE